MEIITTIVLMDYSAIVDGETMLSPTLELGTKDSYGMEQLRIVQGSGWTGLQMLAVFHAPSGAATKVTVGADGVLDVPPKATAKQAGRGKIVFVGLADGAQRITVDLAYTIRDHGDIEGDNPGTPTPDVVQQILANSNNAITIANEARDAAENAHRAAEDAAKKAGEEAEGAAASAAAAKKSAEDAAESSETAAGEADAAGASAAASAENARAAHAAQSNAEEEAQKAAVSAKAAADSAAGIVGAQEASAASAAAAKKSAEDAAESSETAAGKADAAGASAAASAENARATHAAQSNAEEEARKAAASAAAAKKSADSAATAAKTAGDAATKVIEEGVADKLEQMESIQADVKKRQADVTTKQKQVDASVELARQAATANGYMQMGVDPDTGHLLYTRTTNLKDTINFEIVNDTNLEVHING